MTDLSVLELATVASGQTPAQALADTVRIAPEVERLGYRRLWVAEHHGMPAVASSAPAVLIAHLASATSTLRVGSGGVMLPNHAPLVIAEQFATLEALHPGRVDLGLGRAPGTDHRTARALRRAADLGAESFPDDVVELLRYMIDSDDALDFPVSMPGRGYLPEVWLLGSSLYSAQLAGMLGLPFSFAYHFSPGPLDAAVDTYRKSFRASVFGDEPRLMIAAAVLCAPTEEEAERLSKATALSVVYLRTNRHVPFPTPEEAAAYRFSAAEEELARQTLASHIIGDPDTVREGMEALVKRTGADELMLSTRLHSYDSRLQSLSLVAAAWQEPRTQS